MFNNVEDIAYRTYRREVQDDETKH
jgi:hypothetical protein